MPVGPELVVYFSHGGGIHSPRGRGKGDGCPHLILCGRSPPCIFSLVLFQLFIHTPPIYALVRIGANARVCAPPKYRVHREVGPTEHHLAHIIQAVPTQLAVFRGERLDDVAPYDVEAAQLVEQRDAVGLAPWPEVEDAVVGGERGPFCVGGLAGELVVLRGLDVHADGWKKADVPSTRVVSANVGYATTQCKQNMRKDRERCSLTVIRCWRS